MTEEQHIKYMKDLAFKPRLDMVIDKLLRHRFFNLETAMRKEPRISVLFERVKFLEEGKRKIARNDKDVIPEVSMLNDREKHILIGLLNG